MAKTNAEVKERLRAAAKLYSKTAAKQGGAPIPPGVGYEGVIGSCIIGMSKNEKNPRLQVTWPITVTSPDQLEGREHYDFSGLETENNIAYLKGRLEKIDVDVPDDIGDIGTALDECEGLKIRFDVVQNDEFTNTYFRERIGGPSNGNSPSDDENKEPEYTKKELISLGRKADKDDGDAVDELEAAASDSNLDPDDYATWVELAEAVIEELEL